MLEIIAQYSLIVRILRMHSYNCDTHDVKCIAGGSSGGTAVAVAMGCVRVGLGTDTGGSVHIPAALDAIVDSVQPHWMPSQ